MTEEKIRSSFNNFLNGGELLQHRGIRYEAWDEYEKSSKVLPKTGKKLFDPNGSWLQHKQIEKGLQLRNDLLHIERIERKSQLSIAEWLPCENKIRVLKKLGQEWSNFGLEENGVLYLIPEEALVLLEMNCIELLWDGVAISLEQAYNILLDSDISECSLEEYKVYSQFLRCGYRLQRCCNSKLSSKKKANIRESINPRKKIITLPLNGLKMPNDCSQSRENFDKPSPGSKKRKLEDINIKKEDDDNDTNEDCVQKVIESIISNLESKEHKPTSDNKESPKLIENNDFFKSESSEKNISISPVNLENKTVIKKNCNSKVEIISAETVLNNVKILKEVCSDNIHIKNCNSKWIGTRIERNIKLLPKRVDQLSMKTIAPEHSQVTVNENTNRAQMKRNTSSFDSPMSKNQLQEIIELSDDEVEEVQKPLSRMEILNQLPNIASGDLKISQRTLKGYIPHNIEPRRDVYHYDKEKWLCLQTADNSHRLSAKSTQNNQYSARPCPNLNERSGISNNFSYAQKSQVNIFHKYNRRTLQTNQVLDFQNYQWNFCNKNPFFQHTWLQNRHFQGHNYSNALVGLMGNVMNSYFVRNQFLPNLQSIPTLSPWQNSFIRGMHNSNLKQSFNRPRELSQVSNNKGDFTNGKSVLTFARVQKPSTWCELKKRWQEERTITINDEDLLQTETEKYNEIERVEQEIKPLIDIKQNTRLSEVSDKLKLIKKSTEKSQRHKEWDYNISFNVYSGGLHYKKANPGTPVCRLLIIREDEDHVYPLEVQRLPLNETDAPLVIAYVSKVSISYVKLGTVSLPDLS